MQTVSRHRRDAQPTPTSTSLRSTGDPRADVRAHGHANTLRQDHDWNRCGCGRPDGAQCSTSRLWQLSFRAESRADAESRAEVILDARRLRQLVDGRVPSFRWSSPTLSFAVVIWRSILESFEAPLRFGHRRGAEKRAVERWFAVQPTIKLVKGDGLTDNLRTTPTTR